MSDVRKVEIKPQVHEFVFPDGHSVIMLSEGRLLNLGNATGHPSFVMSMSFTNQVLAQIELFTKTEQYPLGVYVLPKLLDERVARLHLDALGVKLSTLSKDQADYIGVPSTAPTSQTTTATDRLEADADGGGGHGRPVLRARLRRARARRGWRPRAR